MVTSEQAAQRIKDAPEAENTCADGVAEAVAAASSMAMGNAP